MLKQVHDFLDLVAYWLRRMTTSRYVLHLEHENRELKAQLAAWQNTAVGLRGMAPVNHATTAMDAPRIAKEPAVTPGAFKPVIKGVAAEARRRAIENAREQERTERAKTRERLIDLQNELNEEIKHEREKAELTVELPDEEAVNANG